MIRMPRRTFIASLAVIALGLAPLAGIAAELQPFAAKSFESTLAAGKPVLLQIHADWCPTCKAQAPILDRLSAEAPYAAITRYRVDFDSQAEVVRKLGAKVQSTLILFDGGKEIARSVGATSEPAIRALLDHAR